MAGNNRLLAALPLMCITLAACGPSPIGAAADPKATPNGSTVCGVVAEARIASADARAAAESKDSAAIAKGSAETNKVWLDATKLVKPLRASDPLYTPLDGLANDVGSLWLGLHNSNFDAVLFDYPYVQLDISKTAAVAGC